MYKIYRKILSVLSPLTGTGGVGVCPLCVAATASVLSWLGLAALIPIWRQLSFALLGLGVIGFLLDARKHRQIAPIILLTGGGVLLYLGRYVYGGRGFTGWPIWGPGAVIVFGAVFYNRYLFRKGAHAKHLKVYTCPICGLPYPKKEYAEQCEIWCKEHPGSCNAEISKYAINSH